MKKIVIIASLLFFSAYVYASFIYNPGTGGGPATLTDSNGCIWAIGNTISTSGAVSVTLLSCPSAGRPCTTGMSLGLLLAITCK